MISGHPVFCRVKRPGLGTALDKLMFIVIGARDFSPEITVHLIGTKVPCFDKVPPPTKSIVFPGIFFKLWDTRSARSGAQYIKLEK